MINNRRILISGASIAGPALAYWLHRYGFEPVIVEKSPALRTGGYKIDTRGKANDVLKAMNLYDIAKNYEIKTANAIFLDDQGKMTQEIPAKELGMRQKYDLELSRGDLSKILYDATQSNCEYIFQDSIQSIHENGSHLQVEFEQGKMRDFDLVIGADGIHSKVRSLAFGAESQFLYNLGNFFYAIYSMPNYLNLKQDELFFSRENEQINLSCVHNQLIISFMMQADDFDFDYRDIDSQKLLLRKKFANVGWEASNLLQGMDNCSDFYFDIARQVRMKTWSQNRISLLGDAAYSPALSSGQGTTMALIGAYVLAGELSSLKGNYQKAYKNYEKIMKKYVKNNQKLGETVMHFIMKTQPSRRKRLTDKLEAIFFNNDPMVKLKKQFDKASQCIELKDYK